MENLAHASDLRRAVHSSAHSFSWHTFPEVLLRVGPWRWHTVMMRHPVLPHAIRDTWGRIHWATRRP